MTQAAGNWQQHQGNWKGAWTTKITNSRAPLAATALPGPARPLAFPHSSLITTPCSFHGSFQCLPNDENEGLKGVRDLPKCRVREGLGLNRNSRYQIQSLRLECAPKQQCHHGRAWCQEGSPLICSRHTPLSDLGLPGDSNTKSVTIQRVFSAISKWPLQHCYMKPQLQFKTLLLLTNFNVPTQQRKESYLQLWLLVQGMLSFSRLFT